MTKQAGSNKTRKAAAPLRSDVKRLVSCCFCGDDFEPWIDEDGDVNNESCFTCDIGYQNGQLNDRNFGCSR